MKVHIFIQARMKSARLPGKVLMDLDGKPLLWYVLDRVSKIRGVDKTVVLMPDSSADNPLEAYCKKNDVLYFRGSEDNVFERFKLAAEQFDSEVVVRLTGDNPFIDPELVERAIMQHLDSNADFTSTREMSGGDMVKRFLPKGFSIDVVKAKHLFDANPDSLDDSEKEHVIPYFFNKDLKISFLDLSLNPEVLERGFSVDTPEDLVLARKILNNINWDSFTFLDVLNVWGD